MIDYGMRNWDADEFDDDDDYPRPNDDEFYEYEDERRAARGTSQCDGLCDPRCDWCLVAHSCPDECAGGQCPYESLDPSLAQERAFELGILDAQEKTKRKRLVAFVDRRAYFRGYETWIRRNSKRARAKERAKNAVCTWRIDIGF